MKTLKESIKESILNNMDVALAKGDNWQSMMDLADIFKLLKANTDFKEYKKIGNELFSSLTEVNKNNIKFNKYYLWKSDGQIKMDNTVDSKKAGTPFYWGVICFNLNASSKDSYKDALYYAQKYNSADKDLLLKINAADTPTITLKQYGKRYGHKDISTVGGWNNTPFTSHSQYENLIDSITLYELPENGKAALNSNEKYPIVK
jgi:hypothetical protein